MNRRKLFLQAITAEQELDIARCAMIVAGEFQPGLNIQVELGAIDQLVTEANSFPVVDAHSLVEFLAKKKRFTGNKENYYSISNSLLNQVLTSRCGIPITLALVYLSVAQKIKFTPQSLEKNSVESQALSAWGINFPGHFLVGVSDRRGEHLIDPFKGSQVSKADCYSIIANLYGRHPKPDDRYFERASSRQILRRILENLKAIHLQNGYAANAMVCLDYQLMLYPEATDLLQQQDELLKFMRDRDQPGENRLQ